MNIADLLLRRQAKGVIAPMVPVNVVHNAMLMARFFVYVEDWRKQDEGHEDSNLLEIWHHVLTTNAVHDVLGSTAWLREWGTGDGVVKEFMLKKSVGRLRKSHVYEDTVTVLQEMASERGVGERFQESVENAGFIPESLFYVALGRPEKLVIRSRIWEELTSGQG